jgi:DNA invertase Pin-like site-specific DNA recombinase
MRIGLARVSTKEQNLDLQLHALRASGCKKIFQEKGSGRAKHRPVLDAAIAALKPGDTLVVWHLDRLGRKARHLINLYYDLKGDGIEIASLTQSIETDTPEGEYGFIVACADAQRESGKISRRTKAGLEMARKRGSRLGRPRVLNKARIQRARRLLDKDPEWSIPKVAQVLSVSRTTLWRAIEEQRTS